MGAAQIPLQPSVKGWEGAVVVVLSLVLIAGSVHGRAPWKCASCPSSQTH